MTMEDRVTTEDRELNRRIAESEVERQRLIEWERKKQEEDAAAEINALLKHWSDDRPRTVDFVLRDDAGKVHHRRIHGLTRSAAEETAALLLREHLRTSKGGLTLCWAHHGAPQEHSFIHPQTRKRFMWFGRFVVEPQVEVTSGGHPVAQLLDRREVE